MMGGRCQSEILNTKHGADAVTALEYPKAISVRDEGTIEERS